LSAHRGLEGLGKDAELGQLKSRVLSRTSNRFFPHLFLESDITKGVQISMNHVGLYY